MPLEIITTLLGEVWQRRTGIGLAWRDLREAEREYRTDSLPGPTGHPEENR
jgi:hypothetical protein